MLSRCLLCERELEPVSPTRQRHPDVPDCLVRVTNQWGICVDEELASVEPDAESELDEDDEPSLLQIHTPIDVALERVFEAWGMPRLGGASSGRGWSSFSTFQACPYKWFRRYVEPLPANPGWVVENFPMAVGSFVHALLAVHYGRMQPDRLLLGSAITPEDLRAGVIEQGCNIEMINEGWRLFTAYRLFYKYEIIEPYALELDMRDPRTNESCRPDLIAYFSKEAPNRVPGMYIIEHKTRTRFTRDALESWPNDGEVLGQIMLWERLGYAKRFGELKGVIVNIIGRQKDPQFHRTIVAPSAWQIQQHTEDLRRWEGLIKLALAYGEFPRARNSCAAYGLCDLFDHCASPST